MRLIPENMVIQLYWTAEKNSADVALTCQASWQRFENRNSCSHQTRLSHTEVLIEYLYGVIIDHENFSADERSCEENWNLKSFSD